MQIKINNQSYKIKKAVNTLLEALIYIKENIKPELNFDYGCKSGVCGACSVRVNGKEQLACSFEPKDGDVVEPIKYSPILRDLIVDKSYQESLLKGVKVGINNYQNVILNTKDEALNEKQSDCILCNSCYSVCPVIEVNKNFLGPFALTRAYRYTIDKREQNPKEIIDSIQQNGIWDCTLCGECTLVCPQNIDPKNDIIKLRNQSAQHGYMDPNFANMGFSGGFGFDPNGGF